MAKRRKQARLVLLIGCVLFIVIVASLLSYRKELIAWYEFWQEFEALPVNAQGLPEYRHRQTGIIFVRIPGGTFMMGSPETEEGRQEHEGPRHEVTLSPFLIAKYEVSQERWKKVMGSNPSHFKGNDHPVERVTWTDCQEFCQKTGLTLPTEAQWEYACRAGTTTPFSFGENITTDQVNYNGDFPYGDAPKGEFRQSTVAVDSFKPNRFGIHQMHGSVWEWCLDVYDEDCYSKLEATDLDPVCTSGSQTRVIRGGSWIGGALTARSAYRYYIVPGARSYALGLRPARVITE